MVQAFRTLLTTDLLMIDDHPSQKHVAFSSDFLLWRSIDGVLRTSVLMML